MLENRERAALFALAVFVSAVSLPTSIVHAGIECTVAINDLNYPLKVNTGQGFDVNTLLTVTCNQASVAVTGRLDLYDNSTGRQLSVSGFPVGANPTAPEWSITAAITSRIQAPQQKGILHLRMVILLSIGEGVPALVAGRLEQSLQVQVGESTSQSDTTTLVIGQGTNSTLTYVFISSNSSIVNANYDSGAHIISFTASGPTGAYGFSAVLIPKYVIDGSPVVLMDNGNLVPSSLSVAANATHYLVAFGYPMSDHAVTIGGSSTIPEFPIPPVVFTLLLMLGAVGLLRRKFVSLRR